MISDRLLITTHSLAGFVERDGSLTKIADGYFYGADFFDDGRFLLAERANPSKEPYSPTRFLIEGDFIKTTNTIRNVHQVTIHESLVFASDTSRDRVVVLTEDLEPYGAYTFSNANKDTLHLNSISFDGSTMLVNLHLRGNGQSRVVSISDDDPYGIELMCNSTHNFEVLGDYAYYNASAEGRVIRMRWPMNEKEYNTTLEVGGHPKGMAFSADASLLYIGMSGVASREHRFKIQSHIAVIDTDRFKVVDMIDLFYNGEPIGNVNEVRVVS